MIQKAKKDQTIRKSLLSKPYFSFSCWFLSGIFYKIYVLNMKLELYLSSLIEIVNIKVHVMRIKH